MTNFTNGRITTSAIIYDRGVPNSVRFFGALIGLNYSMLKQQLNTNVLSRKQKRPHFFLRK
jgi:hypothetical protein